MRDGQPPLGAAAAAHLGDLLWQWDKATLTNAAVRLTDARFQVGVLAVAGRMVGWPASWRKTVRGLRRHTDPGVRDAALAIRTAVE
jgi:hypothetical protein